MDELRSLGYFSLSLRILIFKIIVVLWTPSVSTCDLNFFLSLNFLKTLPWWYAIRIMPFFFFHVMLSHSRISSAAFSGSSPSWTFLVNSALSMVPFITRDSMNFLLISSWLVFSFSLLLHLSTTVKKKEPLYYKSETSSKTKKCYA